MTSNMLVLEGGKYTLVNDLDNGGKFHVLYQEDGDWRSYTEEGLTVAMYREIERLQKENTMYEKAVEEDDATKERLLAEVEKMRNLIAWNVSCAECSNQLAEDWRIFRGSFICAECSEELGGDSE